MVKAYLCFKK